MNFWTAQAPVGVALVAAIIELAIGAQKRRRRRRALDQLDPAPANVIILHPRRRLPGR